MSELARTMQKYMRTVRNIVIRGVLNATNDDGKWQTSQVSMLDGEMVEGAERAQQYGFTSHPQSGAEAIIVHVGADRSHPIILAIDDRRYRVQALKTGEVCIYTDEGDKIHLKRENIIEVTTKRFIVKAEDEILFETKEFNVQAGQQINLETPVLTFGAAGGQRTTATMNADINQNGTHTSTGDQVAGGISQIGHTHQNVQPGGGTSGKPVGGS